MMNAEVFCSDCGAVIDTSGDTVDQRTLCGSCGENRRTHNVAITEKVTVRDGYGVKAKHPGEKRPFVEDKAMPDYSRRLDKFVHLERVIDRDNDQYFEKVTDYETGEVIHHCEEPLSQHQGHGSARAKQVDRDS